jgi:fucose permease
LARARAARRAVFAFFLVHGIIAASWVAHVPLIKDRFALSDAALGLTLFAIAVGSVSSLLAAGALIARFGSRRMTWATALLLCATLPSLGFVRSYPALVALLVLYGAFLSTMDVAMNAQAVGVEASYGRPVMSTFHALWSVGGLIGAGLASLLLSRGVGAEVHLVGVAGALAIAAMVARRRLLPAAADRRPDAPAFVRPPRALLGLGLLAILSMMSEGAIGDWGGVYLRDWLGTSVGFAAIGFAVFSLAMTVGRFFGDALRSRYEAAALLRASGGVAAAGLGAALLLNHPLAALAGFGCMGLGLSNVVPIVFSFAGRVPGVPTGTAVAAVATTGYFGFLTGPPLIGFVAQATILPVGLALVVVFTLLIAVVASSPGPALPLTR